MEFGFASDRTNNAYFDRIIQMGVDTSISEITYCLETCRIAQRAHQDPRLSFPQKACLRTQPIYSEDCARNMSFNTSLEEDS
jgi:hypothetical protein